MFHKEHFCCIQNPFGGNLSTIRASCSSHAKLEATLQRSKHVNREKDNRAPDRAQIANVQLNREGTPLSYLQRFLWPLILWQKLP
jgi:hypothetical protein